MQCQLPPSTWGHAVTHAATLLQFRPSLFNSTSPYHLALGTAPNLSHLRTFGCEVLVPIMGPTRTKLGPQRHKGIYIGLDSSSIIRYIEPTTADIYKARYADCHFFEETFPSLGDQTKKSSALKVPLTWQIESKFWNDPRTALADTEFHRMLHLTTVLENLPESFADVAKVTRSHVPAANVPSRIDIGGTASTAAAPARKRGRPPGSSDRQPRQHKSSLPPSTLAPTLPTPTINQNSSNDEISIHYNMNGQIWDRSTISMDNRFAFQMSKEMVDDLPDPMTIQEARRQPDWDDWQRAIHSELDSLISRQVFGPIKPAPPGTHLTGYRWTFV
ncbi:unnamed protein product [Calypogeia fissa]